MLLWRARTKHLHKKLCKHGWNTSPNNGRMKNRTNLNLASSLSVSAGFDCCRVVKPLITDRKHNVCLHDSRTPSVSFTRYAWNDRLHKSTERHLIIKIWFAISYLAMTIDSKKWVNGRKLLYSQIKLQNNYYCLARNLCFNRC